MVMPLLLVLMKMYYETKDTYIHITMSIGSIELDTRMIFSLSMTVGILFFTLATLFRSKKEAEIKTKEES